MDIPVAKKVPWTSKFAFGFEVFMPIKPWLLYTKVEMPVIVLLAAPNAILFASIVPLIVPPPGPPLAGATQSTPEPVEDKTEFANPTKLFESYKPFNTLKLVTVEMPITFKLVKLPTEVMPV